MAEIRSSDPGSLGVVLFLGGQHRLHQYHDLYFELNLFTLVLTIDMLMLLMMMMMMMMTSFECRK